MEAGDQRQGGGKVETERSSGAKVERCKGERQARHGVRHVWPARRSQTPRAEAARSARSANPAQDIEMVTLFGERTRRSRVPTRGSSIHCIGQGRDCGPA